MKVLDFTISDFGSLQKELSRDFIFSENVYNYFQSNEKNSDSFFKRIYLESGLEVWILSAQFSEEIHLKQNSSNNIFNAIHFLDFNGQFYHSEILKKEEPAKGIYITSSELNLNFKIKAFAINIVSFIYSKRWSDINLFNTTHYKVLFDTSCSLKKYMLQDTFINTIAKLFVITQSSKSNGFSLKINTLTLLSNFLDFVDNEVPIDKIEKFTATDLVLKIEETLSNDFEISLSKIYEEVTKNGLDKKEFIKLFKEKKQYSLNEFRKTKKVEFTLNLLMKGHKTKEVAQKRASKVIVNL